MLNLTKCDGFFNREGWTDALGKLDALAGMLAPSGTTYASNISINEAISYPEAGDAKTDCGSVPDLEYIPHLIKEKKLAKATDLSNEEVVGALDTYVALHSLFLDCLQQPFNASPFLFDMSLTEGHPVLYSCTRAMARSIRCATQFIAQASVQDGEEEFTQSHSDWPVRGGMETEVVIKELDDILNAGPSKTVTDVMLAHVKYHRDWLKVLVPLADITATPDQLKQAKALFEATKASLKALFDRKGDSKFDANQPPQNIGRVFYPPGVMSTTLPTLPALSHCHKNIAAFIDDIEEICTWHGLRTIYELIDTVKAFGARMPSLLARSLARLFIVDEKLIALGERPLEHWILEALDKIHGSPVYANVYFNKTEVMNEVVDFRAAMISKDASRITPTVRQNLKQESTQAMHQWAREAAQVVILTLHHHLRTRGRLHRGMMNMVQVISMLQRQSADIDMHLFTRPSPLPQSVAPNIRDACAKSAVLTAFANELMCHCMAEIFSSSVALNLIHKAELPYVMFYRGAISNFREENMQSLYPTNEMILSKNQAPGRKGVNGPMFGPAVYTREATTSAGTVGSLLEIQRMAAHATLLLFSILQPAITDMKLPEDSLQSLDTIIEGRFFCLMHARGPAPVPWREVHSQIEQMGSSGAQGVSQAAEMFSALVNRIKILRKSAEGALETDYATSAFAKPIVDATDRAAKECLLIANMLKKELAAKKSLREVLSGFSFEVHHQYHPTVTAFKFHTI